MSRNRNTNCIIAILISAWVLSVALVSLVIAWAGRVGGAGPVGVSFLVTGGIIIVLAQLIPAGILLSSLIGTTFSSPLKRERLIRSS